MIECIANAVALTVSAGLPKQGTIPRRNSEGEIIGLIHTEFLPGDVLETQGPAYLPPGERGINLLRLHGGLDLFMTNDGKDVLRLMLLSNNVAGIVRVLQAAHEDLGYADPTTGVPFKPPGEEVYVDSAGDVQFLQRSLLSGRFKYEPLRHQILPRSYLAILRTNMGRVESMVCIGYGFGDARVNTVLREWLEADEARKLEIVYPRSSDVPTLLLHLTGQIKTTSTAATDWLEKYSAHPLSLSERIRKAVRNAQRPTAEDPLGVTI